MSGDRWDVVWTVACGIALLLLIAAIVYLATEVQT